MTACDNCQSTEGVQKTVIQVQRDGRRTAKRAELCDACTESLLVSIAYHGDPPAFPESAKSLTRPTSVK